MENKAQNRRDWVKNIAIIFLVILLLLTFFSRTIMNARLPEVSAQYAQYATLSSAVKASGTVKANESYNVIFEEEEKVEQTRKVQSVYVKAGDTVEKDAPILALSNDPSEQLKQAREDLAKAEEELVKLKESGNVDGMTSDKTLIDAQRKIDKAEDKLKELEAEYKSVLAGGDPRTVIEAAIEALEAQKKTVQQSIKSAQKAIKEVEKEIKETEKKKTPVNDAIDELKNKISSLAPEIKTDVLSDETTMQKLSEAERILKEAETTYNNAKAAFDAKKAEQDEWEAVVEAINSGIGDVNKANELTNQIKSLQETLDALYLDLDRNEEDYRKSLSDLEKKRDQQIENARNLLDGKTGVNSIEEQYNQAVNAAYESYNESSYDLTKSYNRTREDTIQEMQKSQEKYDKLNKELNALNNQADTQLKEWEEKKDQLEELNKELFDAKSERNMYTGAVWSEELQETLNKIDEKIYELQNKIDEINEIKNSYDEIERTIQSYNSQIESLNGTLQEFEIRLQRSAEDYEDNLIDLANTRDKAIAGANTVRTESLNQFYNDASNANETYVKTETDAWNTYYDSVDELQRTHDRLVEDQNAKIHDTEKQIADAQAKLYVIDMPEVDDVIHYEFGYDLGEAQSKLDKAKEAVTQIQEELTKAETERDEAKKNVEDLSRQTLAEGKTSGYEAEVSRLRNEIDYIDRIIDSYNASIDRYNENIEGYNERIESIDEKITEKNDELADVPKKRDPDEVKKEIEEQKETIEDLKETFKITEGTEDNTKADRERGIEKAEKEVKDLREKVKLYEGLGDQKNVTAPIAGRIVSVNFVPGDTVTSGATVASIEIADKGYIVELSMSAEEARRIQVGSPVTVTNSWWYSNISASIAQVKSDPKSQGKNRIIVMDVTGDVSEGQSLNFSIGDRSQSYDSVLPNSAIREDNEGKFVLTVESKKTPLGVRYTARRSAVEIIASDDTQSAVSGLYGSEFVITSSTVPITDGQQVRLAGD